MQDAHGPSLALFTDLYELTMAQAYWQSSQTAPATFSFFFRNYPPNRAYFVLAGVDDVLEYLQKFQLTSRDVEYLHALNRFDPAFIDELSRLRFTGMVRAMREGDIFFADEPVIEVTAPMIEAQLVETFVLNQINFQSILATKCSRVRHAAASKQVIDFAARRTHGLDAAEKLARVAYMIGFDGTSNVHAGAKYGIPVYGTMAHSFVQSFEIETEAMRAYARSFPESSIFLVDTYDTLEGTRRAIDVAREMRRKGHELRAIRLDSGDCLELSRQARAMMDEAGFAQVKIFASGGLDEFGVESLLRAGAPIDGFGVGTKVGVSADAPLTDCAYKLVEYAGRPVLKRSPGKQTLAGAKQIFRSRGVGGMYAGDVIARAGEDAPAGAEPLLHQVMDNGRRTNPAEDLTTLRRRFAAEFASLPPQYKALTSPPTYPVCLSSELEKLQKSLQ